MESSGEEWELIMINDGSEHRLDRLSSGEKSLVQLFLRIGGHMTLNTIVLIDELEVHLHPNMQHRLLKILKQLAIDNPGLTIISTTHSREILRAFAHEIEEKGLVKGGHIISADFNVSE
jgi:predicted ATP-dependent endonuclease of OLD family